jgi:phospholipid/cholesterol/gamma-HCH transport system substrate-binding protein
MIFGKTKLEFKVGLFVFVGMVLLTVFILSLGGFKTWASGYRVHFIFNFVNGVKLGAPVRFAGVDVGEVKEIKFILPAQEPQTKVDLICWIKKEILIPIDSVIWVNTLGLLGEKYVEIMPGTDYSKTLSENQQLIGKDPFPMQEIMESAKRIADDIEESIKRIKNKEGTLGKLIYDDTIYKELEAFAMDLRQNPWKLLNRPKEKTQKK